MGIWEMMIKGLRTACPEPLSVEQTRGVKEMLKHMADASIPGFEYAPPKRPRSLYQLFMEWHKNKLAIQNPDLDAATRATMARACWKAKYKFNHYSPF
jgi:hypothetical protein